MSAVKSYTSFDYQPIDIVPVIASFDTSGHITPLYVRLHGIACKVDEFWINTTFIDIIEFNCKVIVGDRLQQLCLTYYGKEKIWGMPPGRNL